MKMMEESARVGALPTERGSWFRVWAPESRTVEVVLEGGASAGHPLEPDANGWFSGEVEGAFAGTRYRLRLDGGTTCPDPLSRYQPDGVHGASAVVDPSGFSWTDDGWNGRALDDLVIYELHVGTATPEGTFDGLIPRLADIAELGATAIELMPVAEFPGRRNWGYDGVYLFAPFSGYGGPDGLRRLVDAAHAHGLAVILDVVYNHFGPEGNYLAAVSGGRLFTQRHRTPWGAAVNYDDRGCAGVREIVLANAAEWVRDYHIDGLRLDATHAIEDASPQHIVAAIAEHARAATERTVVVIAEDERNDRRVLLPLPAGLGLDAVWADDAHHSMRRLLAGDSHGYYAAYRGTTSEVERTLRQGWLYEGEVYEPSGETRGTASSDIPPQRFVHCLQNHDQVGNRALGERLNHQVPPAAYRAASALLLLSPYTPLLWMGQEWAASTPFQYFTDHPEELGRLVTRGRREEFGGFPEFSDPAMRERIPDPQADATFARSRLRWEERTRDGHAGVLSFYRELLALRRRHPALRERRRENWSVRALSPAALALRRRGDDRELLLVVSLGDEGIELDLASSSIAPVAGTWTLLLHSEEARFGGNAAAVQAGGGRLVLHGPCAALLAAGGTD
jgi:maltooligosyltrehalose trehalohydrolase